ncbi:unnamed protein product, partial [Polarella glacialis]
IYESMGKEPYAWSIAQVSCPEDGCPPVETILTDLGVKGPKPGNGVYKVFKPIPEVTREDLENVLRGVVDQSHGHGHGHVEDGDCCDGHDHGHSEDGHGHGHPA